METHIKPKIAVVIPCYKVSKYIKAVLERIGPEVSSIYCVDDGCPEKSGLKIKEIMPNEYRLKVLTHNKNQGVGASVITGYKTAIEEGAEIIVKIDGDIQMDPIHIPLFVSPIIEGRADYVKGNRFFYLQCLKSMPTIRVAGNAGLSFLSKISTGYWNIFDPTNGFTAIHSSVAKELPFKKIHKRFFFETDMLFHLNLLRAVVCEIPINAVYADEKSNLNPLKALFIFPILHIKNFFIRLCYNYFIRNFSIASLDFFLSIILILFGTIFGATKWILNSYGGITTTSGTVMIAALPIILGFQFFIGFLNFDIFDVPKIPIHKNLLYYSKQKAQTEILNNESSALQ